MDLIFTERGKGGGRRKVGEHSADERLPADVDKKKVSPYPTYPPRSASTAPPPPSFTQYVPFVCVAALSYTLGMLGT